MKKIIWVILLVSFVSLSGCHLQAKSVSHQVKEEKIERRDYQHSVTPTLFFHGYSGTKGSFGSMLKRLETDAISNKEVVITVSASGQLQQHGKLTNQAVNPTIQVLFEDNESDQEHQARWIQSIMYYLAQEDGVKQVNVVGHSMGGVSIVEYLEHLAVDDKLPIVQKVVVIGSPFNDFIDNFTNQTQAELLKEGPLKKSERYQEYLTYAPKLPKTSQFLVISGQLSQTDLSDGRVPLSSSLAIVPLLQAQGIAVESKIATGNKAQHSELHENLTVDSWVRDFLWKK